MNNTVTFLFKVNFMTYGPSDPGRIGTAERVAATITVWASDGEAAYRKVRGICMREKLEFLQALDAEAVTGVLREKIANDREEVPEVWIGADGSVQVIEPAAAKPNGGLTLV